MNITLGEDLAWQERKAASFAFTPFYSGYTVGWTEARKDLRFNGFVPTEFLYRRRSQRHKEADLSPPRWPLPGLQSALTGVTIQIRRLRS